MLFLIGLDLATHRTLAYAPQGAGPGRDPDGRHRGHYRADPDPARPALPPASAIIIGHGACPCPPPPLPCSRPMQRDITKHRCRPRLASPCCWCRTSPSSPSWRLIPLLATLSALPARNTEVTEAVEAIANPTRLADSRSIIIGAFIGRDRAGLAYRGAAAAGLCWPARACARPSPLWAWRMVCRHGSPGTEAQGFSPALGAFIGGVLLADSEYRHELESNLRALQRPAARPVLHLGRHVDRL